MAAQAADFRHPPRRAVLTQSTKGATLSPRIDGMTASIRCGPGSSERPPQRIGEILGGTHPTRWNTHSLGDHDEVQHGWRQVEQRLGFRSRPRTVLCAPDAGSSIRRMS